MPLNQDPRAQALFQALANARSGMQSRFPGGQMPNFNMQERMGQLRQQHPGAFQPHQIPGPGGQPLDPQALIAQLRGRFQMPGDPRQILAQKLAELEGRYQQQRPMG